MNVAENPTNDDELGSGIQVVWSSATTMVVDKPAGMSTTAPPDAESLQSRLKEVFATQQCPTVSHVKFNGYLTAVHRLDRCTSGLVLIALTKKSARLLSEQFVAGKIRKGYLAWLEGNAEPMIKDANGSWTDWMRKIPDQAIGEICGNDTAGAMSCETQVEFVEFDSDANRSLVQLRPATGRMHQLRLQSASRGHPIVGDSLYSDRGDERRIAPRQIALLAQTLEFHDPGSGRLISVASKRSCHCLLPFDS